MENKKIIAILICLVILIPLISKIVLSGALTSEKQDELLKALKDFNSGTVSEKSTSNKGGGGSTPPNTCNSQDTKDIDWSCVELGTEYSQLKGLPLGTVSPSIIVGKDAWQCVRGLCPGESDACCKSATTETKPDETKVPAKDCTSIQAGQENESQTGTCVEKAEQCKTTEGYTLETDKKECPGLCCIPKKCAGTTAKTWEEQKALCKDGAALLPAVFTPAEIAAGYVCCQSKEPAREVPKKPGTWGRLGICFKFEVFSSDEGKWCDKAIGIVTDSDKSGLSTTDAGSLKTKLEAIRNEKKPSTKLDKIDDYNKAANTLKQELTNKAGTNPTDAAKKTLESQQQAIESSQDSIDKIKKIYAVTQFECILNYISVATGIVKTGMLVFGSGDREMGSCTAEVPIRGTTLCSTCNEDPFRICTKERCQILGDCISVAQNDAKQYACIPGKCEDLGNPIFKEGTVELIAKGDSLPSSNKADLVADQILNTQKLTIVSGKIKTEINTGKPIAFNTRIISVNVTTDQPAKCKFILDKKNSSFSEMSDFEENDFPTYKSKASYQVAYVMLPGEISRDTNHRIYIKCQNACGVEPTADYDQNVITFTLDKKPDELPPEIVYVDPAVGSIISSDIGYANASFWLDEQGTCKFSDASINFTIDYNGSKAMVPFNQLSPGINSSVVAGMCSSGKCLDRNAQCARCWLKLDLSKGYELINLSSEEFNETRFYHLLIRCNDVAGNIMTEDSVLDYNFMTAPGYQINITMPEEGQKSFETEPEIAVTSFERTTQCKYKIFNQSVPTDPPKWNDMYFIDEAFAKTHQGKYNGSLEGTLAGKVYALAALCRDQYGLEARDSVTFIVLKDTIAPILVRTYHDTYTGDFLAVETDEKSTCSYSFSGCNFNFSEGVMMAGTEEYIHGTYWKEKTYFIKCYDKWGNFPTETPGRGTNSTSYNYCTAILKPFEIPMIG